LKTALQNGPRTEKQIQKQITSSKGAKTVSIIKKPEVPPEIEILEIQVEQPLIQMLDRYAEFIGSDRNHVIVSAIRVVFKRDYEFKRWLRQKDGSLKTIKNTRGSDEGAPKQVKS
jgi:hypothetical protein